MSKEMTLEEALQIIQDNITPRTLAILTVEFNVVKQALDRLEALNEVWHNNEPMESVDINGKHLQELYNFIDNLIKENKKLKNAIEILKDKRINLVFFRACKDIKEVNLYRSAENQVTQQEYNLLKEVLENDK